MTEPRCGLAQFTPVPDTNFDGETACPECDVVICAYCQGSDPDCNKAHKPECTFWPKVDRELAAEDGRDVR